MSESKSVNPSTRLSTSFSVPKRCLSCSAQNATLIYALITISEVGLQTAVCSAFPVHIVAGETGSFLEVCDTIWGLAGPATFFLWLTTAFLMPHKLSFSKKPDWKTEILKYRFFIKNIRCLCARCVPSSFCHVAWKTLCSALRISVVSMLPN